MPESLTLTPDEFLYFAERAVRGMEAVVVELGDDRACLRPGGPGTNSVYGLLTHCLGVMEYWAGRVVAGREVVRDRPAEFTATGTVAALQTKVEDALTQLRADLATLEPTAPVRVPPDSWADGPEIALTQSGALLHVYEELAQHFGQVEGLRDQLAATPTPAPPAAAAPEPPSPLPAPAPSPFDDLPLSWLRAKHGVKWRRPGPDLLPAWVADMDFPLAPPIREAIQGVLERGDLTYADWSRNPLAEPFSHRMQHRYGWAPDPAHVRSANDLIQALQIVLTLATDPGDGVIAHTPNYPPFLATVARMDRRLVPAPLIPTDDTWTWDHAALQRADAKVLLLVNPQNPTGRVFTRPELERIADLAETKDLLVVSDEIHAELVHAPHRHIPFATLSPETAVRTITITSATKAFNIAGVRTAVVHVGSDTLRRRWDAQPIDLFGGPNVVGVEATLAAWHHGTDWLTALNTHLKSQRDHLATRLAAIPGASMRTPEAGYLAWLDLAEANLDQDPAQFLQNQAKVYLSPGPDYGPGNETRARLNFATSRPILDEILDRIATAIAGKP